MNRYGPVSDSLWLSVRVDTVQLILVLGLALIVLWFNRSSIVPAATSYWDQGDWLQIAWARCMAHVPDFSDWRSNGQSWAFLSHGRLESGDSS